MIFKKDFMIQGAQFLVVGVITLLIDLAVTIALNNLLHFPPYLSSAIGFLSGFVFNFPMNRKKVFKHSKDDRFRLMTQIYFYITLCALNLLITSLFSELLVAAGLYIAYAKLIITAMISIWNFLIFRYFVFSKKTD